jgi:choline dehydrogenase-like flavoprotein
VLRGLPSALTGSLRFIAGRYLRHPPLPGFFVLNPARTYGLSYHAEHFPSASSRVWLADDTDRYGMRRLCVDLRFSKEDATALFRAHELMREWLDATRLGVLRYRQPAEETAEAILGCAQHGTHQIGTIRAGRHRNEAVVDSNLQTLDLRNLYVASSAIFPSSGQANPTLTIVALALRLADHLARR